MKVKPDPERPGLIVRDPVTGKRLTTKGKEVPDNPYWRRRLRDVDVVPSETAKTVKVKKTSAVPPTERSAPLNVAET